MYEGWRRLVVVCGIAGGLLLATWASFAPLVTVERVHPKAEQDNLIHGGYFPSKKDKELAALSPEEYVATITAGAVYPKQGAPWPEILNVLTSPTEAGSNWRWRLDPDRHRHPPRPLLFFHENDEPVRDVTRWMEGKGLRTAYVEVTSPPNSDLLRVSIQRVGLGDFSLGQGYMGSSETPSRLLFPGRRFALPFLLVCLAVYVLLPWPKRGPTTVAYRRQRLITGDVVGASLFALFFTMPGWITGTAQGLVAYWPLTAMFWLMASFGLIILIRSAWYAKWCVVIRKDGLEIATRDGFLRLPYSKMKSRRPVVLRSPRWLRRMMWLAVMVRPEPALAGNAALMSGVLAGGDEIELDDGSVVYLWHDGRLGGSMLTHAEVLAKALENIPSSTEEAAEVVGFGAPFAAAAPAGKKKSGR